MLGCRRPAKRWLPASRRVNLTLCPPRRTSAILSVAPDRSVSLTLVRLHRLDASAYLEAYRPDASIDPRIILPARSWGAFSFDQATAWITGATSIKGHRSSE